jgi:hypothetical protein
MITFQLALLIIIKFNPVFNVQKLQMILRLKVYRLSLCQWKISSVILFAHLTLVNVRRKVKCVMFY